MAGVSASRGAAWYGTRWRNVFAAAGHNTWIFPLAMLMLLSHRNIVTAMVLMGAASLVQPGIWPAFAALFRRATLRGPGGGAVLLALLAFCGFALLSVVWVPDKAEWTWALQILLFFLFAAAVLWTMTALPRAHAGLLSACFLGTSLVGMMLLGIEGLSGGALRDAIPPDARPDKDLIAAARGVSIAISFLPGTLLLLWALFGRWRALAAALGAGAVLSLAAGALLLGVSANVLALAATLGAGALALWRPGLVLRATFLVYAAALLFAPFIALGLPPLEEIARLDGGPTSWLQRLGIWRFTAEHIFASPKMFLIGGGVNFGQVLSDAQTMITLPGYPAAIPVMPSHPHNVFLQIWLEFGLVGVALVLAALYAVWRWARGAAFPGRAGAALAAAMLAIAAANFIYASIELSLWTPWRLAAPVFGLYACIGATRVSETRL